MKKTAKDFDQPAVTAARRQFLTRTAALTTGAAIAAQSSTAAAQSPISIRWQTTWSAKEIYYDHALDFAKKVNDMSGGRMVVEVFPANALVKSAGLIDAVSSGAVDGGHCVLSAWTDKTPALALWSAGPAFGMDADLLLAWHNYGGGRALLDEVFRELNLNVLPFLYGPLPAQPLGWFKKPLTKPQDLKGLRFGIAGFAAGIYTGMGASVQPPPAADMTPEDEKRLDGTAFNDITSDRSRGFHETFKVCMLGGYQQSAGQLAVILNRRKFDSLPIDLRAVFAHAVGAASADLVWKSAARNARDYAELKAKHGVRFVPTADAILQAQLKAWDGIAARISAENTLFGKIYESQRVFAKDAAGWQQELAVGGRSAYNHFFAAETPRKKK